MYYTLKEELEKTEADPNQYVIASPYLLLSVSLCLYLYIFPHAFQVLLTASLRPHSPADRLLRLYPVFEEIVHEDNIADMTEFSLPECM